jgi:glutamate--cysteine ligase
MPSSDIIHKIIDVVGSKLRTPETVTTGVEIENILYDNNLQRVPVNIGETFSIMDIKERLESTDAQPAHVITVEPGGQLEYASPPRSTLDDLKNAWNSYLASLLEICEEENLMLLDFALDPLYSPDDIAIIDHKKYHLMWQCFATTGKLGHWMMLNTTSVQINYDYTSLEEAERLAFLADALHPFVSVIFANAPFRSGSVTGNQNIREIIWNDTDPARCGTLLDHNISASQGLVRSFIDYLLATPTIFTLTRADDIGIFDGSLMEWLSSLDDEGGLGASDALAALHHIFTQVRFKEILEIRGPDRPPFGFELAPVAFLTGLLRTSAVSDKLYDIILSWSPEERRQVQSKAQTLDLSQKAFGRRTFHAWIEQLFSMALDGLTAGNAQSEAGHERIFLESFAENFLRNGPVSLQIQKDFENSSKSINIYIRDRWLKQKEALGAALKAP